MIAKSSRHPSHGPSDWRSYQGGDHFWHLYRESYNLLSAFTSPDDWQCELKTIAAKIAGMAGIRQKIEVADIGAGNGMTSKQIADRLSFDFGIASRWTLTEPNATSRTLQLSVFPTTSAGYRLEKAVYDLPVGNGRQFDFILFLHSSYYTEDMHERIIRYRADNLNPGGSLLILAMERTSPFFLGSSTLAPHHTATDIERFLRARGIEHSIHRLPMRMRVPETLAEQDSNLLYKLMANGHMSRVRFGAQLRKLFNEPNDLQDRLILIPA